MTEESRIIDIENHLKTIFKAVSPDPGFVQNLKNKLSSNSEILLEQKPNISFVIFTVFSILLSGLILWFFRRHVHKPSL